MTGARLDARDTDAHPGRFSRMWEMSVSTGSTTMGKKMGCTHCADVEGKGEARREPGETSQGRGDWLPRGLFKLSSLNPILQTKGRWCERPGSALIRCVSGGVAVCEASLQGWGEGTSVCAALCSPDLTKKLLVLFHKRRLTGVKGTPQGHMGSRGKPRSWDGDPGFLYPQLVAALKASTWRGGTEEARSR